MNKRRNSGSITGFSVACLFIIIIVAVFAYNFTLLVGGGEQLQNACDSGTLNLARAALISPKISLNDAYLPKTGASGNPLPYQDFFACIGETAPDNSQGVNLLNYNSVLAQALIVASNAEASGTSSALSHANDVVEASHALGAVLRDEIQSAVGASTSGPSWGGLSSTVVAPASTVTATQKAFTSLAQSNRLNMLGDKGSVLTLNSMAVAWMQPGTESSIYVDPATVSAKTSASLPLKTATPIQPTPSYTPSTKLSYVAGYQAIPVLNNTNSIAFLVDRPQRTTSLVSQTDFQASTTPLVGTVNAQGGIVSTNDLAYLPPNSFQAACHAQKNGTATSSTSSSKKGTTAEPVNGSGSSNITLTTLASSIIGAVNNGTVASIPAGYIQITNKPSPTAPDENVYDASNKDLFDDVAAWPYAVWVSPPIQTRLGTACLFSSNLVSLSEWYAWANSTGNDRGHERSLDPLVPYGSEATKISLNDDPSPRIRIALGNCPVAHLSDLMAFKGVADNHWAFSGSNFSLTSRSQIIHFLAFAEEKTSPDEWNKLVTGGDGSYYIQAGSMFPLFDQGLDGSEPAYIPAISPTIAAYYNRLSIQHVHYAVFPDGVDNISWIKLGIIKDRAQYKYEDWFTLPTATQTGSDGIKYSVSGKLVYPNRWGVSPYSSDPKAKYAYLQHHAVYAVSTSGTVSSQSQQYAFTGSPYAMIQDIDMQNNGLVPYLPNGSTNNGVVDTSGSGDHTFDPNQPAYLKLMNAILQRCQEIQPSCTMAQVISALSSSKLPMGQTAYLHLSNGSLTLGSISYADTNLSPDGNSPVIDNTGWITCAAYGGQTDQDLQYNSLINTSVDNVYARRSDANFHKAAWKWTKGDLQYQDQTIFQSASGYHNLLGVLTFETDLRNVSVDNSGNMTDNGGSLFLSWPN